MLGIVKEQTKICICNCTSPTKTWHLCLVPELVQLSQIENTSKPEIGTEILVQQVEIFALYQF